MKLSLLFKLAVLGSFKDVSKALVSAKSVQSKNVSIEPPKDCDHANSTSECFFEEGRRRKVGANGNKVVYVDKGDNQGNIGGFGLTEYYVEEEDDSRRKVKRPKGKKGGKKHKKMFKKMAPLLMGLGAMKLLLYHLAMKKMAFVTFISFLLSKISFVLASLVALKQFFHTPTHHRSAESNKLEVVHIPIRKHRHHSEKDKDSYYDESQLIPVTFSPETAFDTTPFYYDLPYNGNNPETFSSSEENLNQESYSQGIYNDRFNNIYNEHFNEDSGAAFDRSDSYSEKNFYKNHVHSPFV